MKTIYDSIKSIQNQPAVKYRSPVDDDYDDYYAYDDDYSEDEGTSVPINAKPMTNSYTTKPEVDSNPHSKLLSGYTSEDWEINVNISHVHHK